jgi:FtsP/CotA-like multicopper oxidase with cupredoxin domain
MHRRNFLELVGGAGALSLARPMKAMLPSRDLASHLASSSVERSPLVVPEVIASADMTLVASAHKMQVSPRVTAEVWSVGSGALCPTLKMKTGDTTRIRFENNLPEPSILHWHGMLVPDASDGHPRHAVGTGGHYQYSFPVVNRAGTYWYHAHPHGRTGIQVYRGMAGLLLVEDGNEAMLGLPDAAHELPIIVQDKRLDANGSFTFDPKMHEQMEGYFGDTPYVNGVRVPFMAIETTTYRLRLVNATTSRILRLQFSNKMPFTLIGGDGGLYPEATELTTMDLGTGERVDLLVDFGKMLDGQKVTLLSTEFASPATMAPMPGHAGAGIPQGSELKLVEFEVTKVVKPQSWKPMAFPSVAKLNPAKAVKTRKFSFESQMMKHTINGKSYDMGRVDETVKFGTNEIWTFTNSSSFAHPVHMHAVQFQILERKGGRARLFPWERGWKDTVLLFPGETVSVIAAFDRNKGRFLMHCHNMVHEDMGMMMNFDIV